MLHNTTPRIVVAAMCALVLAGLLSCGGSGDDQNPDEGAPRTSATQPIIVAANQPVRIGASMVLTGPNGSAGSEDTHAIVTAISLWKQANGDDVKGHPIELVVEDDGCTDVDAARTAAERLLGTPGLVGVIGPSCSAGAESVLEMYDAAGIVLISGAATRTDLTSRQSPDSFFFRTIYRNELQGRLAGNFAKEGLKANTAFLIDDGEAYGQDFIDAAQAAMEDHGIAVTRESVRRGQVDFADLARRVTSANPDFVGFGGFNPEAALFYGQLRDAGYGGTFGAGDAAASVKNFVEPVGEQAEGVYFAGCPLALPEEFSDLFRTINGGDPDASSFVAHTADAARILLDAVNTAAKEQPDGSLTIDPAELRDAVRATDLTDGISGDISLDERGDRTTDGDTLEEEAIDLGWVACQVQSGRLVNTFP
jgi:branched-chain amino acid transport system substrate-binding protein